MKSKKVLSLIAVATLATTILVGCGGSKNTVSETGLKDGKYTAESEVDDKGNKSNIEIEVKDGKIATVKYDEVNAETGVSKLDNAEYNTKMKEVSGSNPVEAFPKLEASLIEKQDAPSVDVVTGATGSSESFKTLAAKALESAK